MQVTVSSHKSSGTSTDKVSPTHVPQNETNSISSCSDRHDGTVLSTQDGGVCEKSSFDEIISTVASVPAEYTEITVTADNLSGSVNVAADWESRHVQDISESDSRLEITSHERHIRMWQPIVSHVT